MFCIFFFIIYLFILLSVLPIFQVIRFPVSIILNTYHKKIKKVFNLFMFFQNDGCTGANRNGTCYTRQIDVPTKMIGSKILCTYLIFYILYCVFFSEECSSKGGTQDGSCASGFGVCCVCMNKLLYFLTRGHLHIT